MVATRKQFFKSWWVAEKDLLWNSGIIYKASGTVRVEITESIDDDLLLVGKTDTGCTELHRLHQDKKTNRFEDPHTTTYRGILEEPPQLRGFR